MFNFLIINDYCFPSEWTLVYRTAASLKFFYQLNYYCSALVKRYLVLLFLVIASLSDFYFLVLTVISLYCWLQHIYEVCYNLFEKILVWQHSKIIHCAIKQNIFNQWGKILRVLCNLFAFPHQPRPVSKTKNNSRKLTRDWFYTNKVVFCTSRLIL